MKSLYNEKYQEVNVYDIQVVDYRRKKQYNLEALIESIKYNGLTNPITVEQRPNGTYELIAGFHRLQAFKALFKETIPCMVRIYNRDVLERDRELQNKRDKHEENHVRQKFTVAEIARDYIEIENAYINAFPDYAINPIKYLEYYRQKMEEKKRAENMAKTAKTATDKGTFTDLLVSINKDIDRIMPPEEEIKTRYNTTKKENEAIRKIVEAEKNVILNAKSNGLSSHSFIGALEDEGVKPTTLVKIADKLTNPDIVSEYIESNSEERKEIIESLKMKADMESNIKDKEIPKIKLEDGVYEIGKVKKHCVVMADKRHLVAAKKYNVIIEVKNRKMFDVVSNNIIMAHTNVLAVMYNEQDLEDFVKVFVDMK